LSKISGPLLDRIDIHVEIKQVQYKKLDSSEIQEKSEDIRKRVNSAKKIQLERYKNLEIFSNAELTHSQIEQFCKLDDKGKEILKKSFINLELSARAYDKILKISRTIADLDGKENIMPHHIAEAIQYRSLDRKYWKR
jgi:magnesium chelatase family protein